MRPEENSGNIKLFEEDISSYHNPHHLMYKKMGRVFEHVRPKEALLDVGCGIGEFIVQLKDHCSTLVGIDIDKHRIEFAKKRLAKHENVSLYCGELESFHFPDEHFDVCLCLDVLEHVANLFPLLQEIYRILRPRAEMIVTVPNWYDIIISGILRRNPYHIHTLAPWTWMKLLRQAGFRIKFYRAVDFPIIKSDFLARKIPIFGMCIMIIAVK